MSGAAREAARAALPSWPPAESGRSARREPASLHRPAMNAQGLLSALVDELPAPTLVEPFAFLDDDLLPPALTPVEPAAFAIACAQGLWGARGPRN
jgi:hypothetical protein